MIFGQLIYSTVLINAATLTLDTRIAGNPDEPTSRLVRLYRENDDGQAIRHGLEPLMLTIVATVWTDPNGKRVVQHLDPTHRFTAIAYDHTGQFDPVIKAGLVPATMEANP